MGTNTMPAAPEAPEALATDLCWLLSRANQAMGSQLAAALEDLGLSPRGYHVLRAAMAGEHSQIELARTVGLDKTTMVVTLDELEEAGLAERRPSPTDRRARVIAVTDAGERKVAEADEILAEVRREVLESIPEADREVFLASLRSLVCERLDDPDCAPLTRKRSARA
ncbi:MAG TPA: MarR family transcriptional regulator [Solirubrobacterales bacterium]|nr:MarR family transcriptional regulator [Solirubrobacterales bacterium]